MTDIERIVRDALASLCASDGDHARVQNGVGLNRLDNAAGHSLNSRPTWTPAQLALAHRIVSRYPRQVGPIPPLPDAMPSTVSAGSGGSGHICSTSTPSSPAPEWGLQWGQPQTLNPRQGLRPMRSATPPAAFWADWKRNKDGVKARGYGVSKGDDGAFRVQHWAVPTTVPAEVAEPEAPRRPLDLDPTGLLAYQVPAMRDLATAVREHGAALDGSDTGTGKTYVALASMRALGLQPLVICPKAVIPSWERAAAHLGMTVRTVNYEKVRTGNTPWGSWETVTAGNGRTYDRFVWSPNIQGLVFDEGHRCKSTKSQNASMLIGAGIQRIPTIVASATAVISPLDMRALGYVLGLHNLRDFYAWCEAHGCYRNRWDGWEFDGSGETMETIRSQIFPGRGVRIRVADLGDAFPATLIDTVLVDVESPAKVEQAHASLAAAFDAIRERSKSDKSGAEHLTAMLRARQVSETQKLPAVYDMACDALEDGRSVVIGVNFGDSIRSLVKMFGKVPVVTIHGDQTAAERQEAIDLFQANRVHVMILNMAAGGVGVSLHDLHGRPRTSIACPGEDARLLRQFLGRVWRAGGVSGSVQHIVYARGTVEERVAARQEDKLRRLTVFNDGLEELEIVEQA